MVKSLRLALAVASMCFAVIANAQSTKSYTETLVVTINETSSDPQLSTVNVETLENGNINFTLNDFILVVGEDAMPIGNISVSNLALTDEGYCKSFSFDGMINILPGSKTIVFGGETVEMADEDWTGPMLGEIPLKLVGKVTNDHLFVTINITMAALGQDIVVVLGEEIEAPAEPVGPAVVSTKDYSENLVVTINETSSDPQLSTVKVETLENGNINFTLNDFILVVGEDAMPIGNISVSNLALTDEGYCKSYSFEGNINILPGSKTIVFGGETVEMADEDWTGPMLGEIPVKLVGKMTDDHLFVTINITMEALGQDIVVVLGEEILDPVEVGVSSIESTSNTKVAYDLSGRRVQNLVKGNVYVIDGKKVMK